MQERTRGTPSEAAADFAQWWISVEPALLRTARRLSASRDQAQDLVQDIAVLALEDPSRFPSQGHFASWAYKRLYGLAIDAFRAKRRWEILEEESVPPQPPDQEGAVTAKTILEAMKQLPERQRQVLQSTIEGVDTSEVAKELEIAPATVRSLRRLARDRLAQILTQMERGRPAGDRI